eukprot:CAMPEP_0202341748 /NCGR_PEP_ID=MMETSP1126-20121109/2604_1 /ASSEMBLY_ACC=CAM_ASM_000457 /TAXON_ID=3047 /ORGANISM="Dunaliella tertiolecta, Strain CCMP1320" /LENGTH=39 /DNA_ID= /DNA_START= /DNA_END= /DNA_ORIENTATION=
MTHAPLSYSIGMIVGSGMQAWLMVKTLEKVANVCLGKSV